MPHMVCIQETWMKDDYVTKYMDYERYFENRIGRKGIEICMLLQNVSPLRFASGI